jgi:AcrR family transcriptional regulator
MALAAARDIVEKDGLRALTTRGIAAEIGYSAGTLYNLFEDLDDLIVHLNGRTLDALYDALSDLRPDREPETAVRVLAEAYIRFTSDHPRLWNVLFEHRLPEGRLLPEWYHEKVARLLGLLERALAPLFPAGREADRHHSARVLWSSLHGICSLEVTGKFVATESVTAMAETLVDTYVAGLRHRTS